MPDMILLSHAHMQRIEPFFPRSRGLARVDDRRVVNGIIHVIRNCAAVPRSDVSEADRGRQWKDAPLGYGPHKTLCNRFIQWSRPGVFARIFAALAAGAACTSV